MSMFNGIRWWAEGLFVAILAFGASNSVAAEFGAVLKVSGDRQIVVGPFNTPKAPFTVRVLDAGGSPLPGTGVVIIAPLASKADFCPANFDEFGFAGFNAYNGHDGCSLLNGTNFGFTDANGFVTLNPSDRNAPPSTFLIGASAAVGNETVADNKRYQYFTIVRAQARPPGNPSVVVEYFHDGFRHYFNTLSDTEISVLDAGMFPGWMREVGGFIAWKSQVDAPSGAVPVCRFFSSLHTSHFYTADPQECDAVVANFPEWQLETRTAYWIFLPDKTTGLCANGLLPVYRVFKPASPNHRYVTDVAVRNAMMQSGWIAEGYGPNAVIMCTAG